jgi:hypothetical protein
MHNLNGLSMLWDYLEDYENDTGEEMELDVIALCCDFAVLTQAEMIQDYSIPEDIDWEDMDAILEHCEGLERMDDGLFLVRSC